MLLTGSPYTVGQLYLSSSWERLLRKGSLLRCPPAPGSGASRAFPSSPGSLLLSSPPVSVISFPLPASLIISSFTAGSSWTVSSCLAPASPPSSTPFVLSVKHKWKACKETQREKRKVKKNKCKWNEPETVKTLRTQGKRKSFKRWMYFLTAYQRHTGKQWLNMTALRLYPKLQKPREAGWVCSLSIRESSNIHEVTTQKGTERKTHVY